jgi:hypothetical protein
MLEQTYLKWLGKEVVAAKYALLVALEKRDNLLYIEEPDLKEEYMQKIGMYEEQVLKLELEVSLQEKKKLMIQAAINRREPVDLEAIEKQLDEERASQLNRLNETYKAGTRQNETLTVEEKEELQSLYKEIVREFHPQVRSNMTETEKYLYKKALDAYKRQNLEEMRLIHDMLFSSEAEGLPIEVSEIVSEDAEADALKEIAKEIMEDYSLAAELYSCFEVLEEDAVLHSAKTKYENMQEAVVVEIEGIMNRFPFIAKDTMRDEEKLKAYLDSLSCRMNSAKESLNELQAEIETMIGA